MAWPNHKKIIIFLVLALAAFLVFNSLFLFYLIQTKPIIKPAQEESIQINGSIIKVTIASEPREQYLGLSGRQGLCSDCGLLFDFPSSQERNFVMRDMNFPLDIIFINKGRIIKIFENLAPENTEPLTLYNSGAPADQVLEVNAGYARQHNLIIGSQVNKE